MYLIKILRIDIPLLPSLLIDLNRPPHHHVHRTPIRHQANVIIKNASCMKQRNRKAHRLLHHHLQFIHHRILLAGDLIVQVILAKRQHRHEIGAHADRQLDEALPAVEHELQRPRHRIERLARAADHDRHRAAHALVVQPALREQVLDALAGHGRQAHGERVVAVQRDAEVGVEGEQRVRDAGVQVGEADGLGAEGGEGAVADDPVRVVPEDVFARGGQRGGAVQAHREVGGEEGPELAAAEPL